MKTNQELQQIKDFVDNTYNRIGNHLSVDTSNKYDPTNEDSKLGYCYKYIDDVLNYINYRIVCSYTGDEFVDFRVLMHEYGHLYLGHLDGIHEQLDSAALNVFENNRGPIVDKLNKDLGIEDADKLIQRIIDDPNLNHTIHNIAMDMEVNSKVLSTEDIEKMEKDLSNFFPKDLENRLASMKDVTDDPVLKKELEETLDKLLKESKIKFVVPERCQTTDESGNKVPFPSGKTYAEYFIMIIRNLDQFVKLLISIRDGGNGDTSKVTQSQIRKALGQQGQQGQQNQSSAFRQGYQQGLQDAQSSGLKSKSEEYKKGFRQGYQDGKQSSQQNGSQNQNGQQTGPQNQNGQQNGQNGSQNGSQNSQQGGSQNSSQNQSGSQNGQNGPQNGQQNQNQNGQQNGGRGQNGPQNGSQSGQGSQNQNGQQNQSGQNGPQNGSQNQNGGQNGSQNGQQNGSQNQNGQQNGQQNGSQNQNGQQNGSQNQNGQQNGSQNQNGGQNGPQNGSQSGQGSQSQSGQQNGPQNGPQSGSQSGSQNGQQSGQGSQNGQQSGSQNGSQSGQGSQSGPQGSSQNGQGSQSSSQGNGSQNGSGNSMSDYQQGYRDGFQQGQKMGGQGQQGQGNQQGQGQQCQGQNGQQCQGQNGQPCQGQGQNGQNQGQGQGQPGGQGQGSQQAMDDFQQGYQQGLQDGMDGNGGQNGQGQGQSDTCGSISNLLDELGLTDPGQKKGEGRAQKTSGDNDYSNLDHNSPSREEADELRRLGKITSSGGIGCSKEGVEDGERTINYKVDEVDVAINEVIRNIKKRVVKRDFKRDVLKKYNHGINKKTITPSISNKVTLSMDPKLVFLIDISGSMDTRLIDRILLSISKNLKKINRGLKYDIIAWNTQLAKHYRDVSPLKRIPTIPCNGGTDMAGGIKYFRENFDKNAILILVSDFEDNLNDWHEQEKVMKGYSLYGWNYGRYSRDERVHWTNFIQRNFSDYGYIDDDD